MKKKTAVLSFMFGLLLGGNIYAGYPVLDITSVIAAIENGYTMYEQLQSMYQNVQNGLEQLNETRKNFEAFDPKQLSASDPLGSWRKIMTYGNRMMNYQRDMENIINNKNIKIGNGSFSMYDLYTPEGGGPMAAFKEGVGFMTTDAFRDRTPQEKAIFHQKYGMSYGNYMRYHAIGEATSKKVQEVLAVNAMLEEGYAEDMKALDSINAENAGAESIVAQAQTTNAQLAAQNKELKAQTMLVSKLASTIANSMGADEIARAEAQRQRNHHNFDTSEAYINLMNGSKHKASSYKGSKDGLGD